MLRALSIEAKTHESKTVWLLTSHLKNIKVRYARRADHFWRSNDALIRDDLLWTSTHGRASFGRPAWMIGMDAERDSGKFVRSAKLDPLFIKIQPIMSEREKKWQRIYDSLNAKTRPKKFRNYSSFFMASIKPRP